MSHAEFKAWLTCSILGPMLPVEIGIDKGSGPKGFGNSSKSPLKRGFYISILLATSGSGWSMLIDNSILHRVHYEAGH
jgi:hypothetical protein